MDAPMWERLPDETDKSWLAFEQYREMPVFSDVVSEKRSLANLAEKLGYTSPKQLEVWSTKYGWVERVRAFDMHNGMQLVTFKQATLTEFQQGVVNTTTALLVQFDQVVQRKLVEMSSGELPPAKEIKAIAEAIRISDDLKRRSARMPTTYLAEKADENGKDEETYIMGAD